MLLVVSIGEVAGVAKSASLAVKPVTSVVRWLRPDTSPRAISAVADDLAAEVLRRESQLLDQLAGGPDRFIDVGLSLSARQRLTTEEDRGVVDLTELGDHYLALPSSLASQSAW